MAGRPLREGVSVDPAEIRTEKALFGFLGMEYVPPELREGMGEIEAAEMDEEVTISASEAEEALSAALSASDGDDVVTESSETDLDALTAALAAEVQEAQDNKPDAE